MSTMTTTITSRPIGTGSGSSTGADGRAARAPGRGAPPHGSHGPRWPALIGVRGGLVEPVDPAAERAALAGRRRGEPAGQPEVAEEDREGEDEPGDEQPDLDADAGPEDLVVADALEPDRVGPELDPDDDHDDRRRR